MDAGGGHRALRDSVHASLRDADPSGLRFEIIPWDSANRLVDRIYALIVHRTPRLQQLVFDAGKYDWGVRLAVSSTPDMYREAARTLREARPAGVLSTHWLLGLLFARARRALSLDVPLISAIPDYGIPIRALFPAQAALQSDYLAVMDQQAYVHLVGDRRLPPDRVCYTGFLPREPFRRIGREIGDAPRLDRQARARLVQTLGDEHPEVARIDLGRPTLIFLGGSGWTEKTRPVIDAVVADRDFLSRVNVLVVCGRNAAFQHRLLSTLGDHPGVTVFGRVTPAMMAGLMALADLPVLGSLAPATMHELLEVRCGPLWVHRFIPGAEAPHVPYVERHQIGLYEPDAERMLECLKEAAGIIPAGGRVRRLLAGFPARAAAIRRAHEARARDLAPFLERVLACPVARAPGPATVRAETL
jgi:hypothetical protein